MSFGVKGARLGVGPRGTYVHMGRKGLYFRRSLNTRSRTSHNHKTRKETSHARDTPSLISLPDTIESYQEIDSGSVLTMADTSSADLLNELNDKSKRHRLFPIPLCIAGIAVIYLFVIEASLSTIGIVGLFGVALSWLTSVYDKVRSTTVVLYNLESDVEAAYKRLHEIFGRLKSCSRVWHVEGEGVVRDRKYHAGANTVASLNKIILRTGEPPMMKTNIEVPLIPVGTQVLAFMPDVLLVFEDESVGAVSYSDLESVVTKVHYVEKEDVPSDAKVVGYTWRYVRKDGGPDQRFKNNRQKPLCEYEQLAFTSASGLNETIQISRLGIAEEFISAISELRESFLADGTVV